MDDTRSQNQNNLNNTEQFSTISSVTSYKKLRRLDSYVDKEKLKLGLDTPLIAYGKHYQRTLTKANRAKSRIDDSLNSNSESKSPSNIHKNKKYSPNRKVKFLQNPRLNIKHTNSELDISIKDDDSIQNNNNKNDFENKKKNFILTNEDKKILDSIGDLSDEEKKKIILLGINSLPKEERDKIILKGIESLSEKEKKKIKLLGINSLPKEEKDKIILKGIESLSEKEKKNILLNGFDQLSESEKRRILDKSKDIPEELKMKILNEGINSLTEEEKKLLFNSLNKNLSEKEKKNILLKGYEALPEEEKNNILLKGYEQLSEDEKNEILLKGFEQLPEEEKNNILLKGFEQLSEDEKNNILLKGYDEYLREKDRLRREEENEKMNKYNNGFSDIISIDDKYSKEQTINFDKFSRDLTQDEIDEWRRIKKLPWWKRKALEVLNISEKEYDKNVLRLKNKENENKNDKSNVNINPYNINDENIPKGPYTTRGINDYNNNILMFPIYKQYEMENQNKSHRNFRNINNRIYFNFDKYKKSNPLLYVYPPNKYRQLYQTMNY